VKNEGLEATTVIVSGSNSASATGGGGGALGPLAQRRYKPRSWRYYHGWSDFEKTADLALTVCGGSADQTEAFLG